MIVKVENNYPRLDKYLIKLIDSAPMPLIQRLIRKKSILVNNIKAKPSQKLLKDDEISIFYNFKTQKENSKKKISTKANQFFLKKLVYENEDFIIVNKPPNIAVQGGSKINTSLKDIYESILQTNLYLVHRIDKDTSGFIILVKSRFIAADFSNLFLQKKINKYYLTITDRKFEKNSSLLLNKNNDQKEMRLRYRYLKKLNNSFIYYVYLLTGKKHQIRLQFSLNNNPIKNDNKFNLIKNKKNLCLYSFSLSFTYKNKFYNFKLPLEETLQLNNH